MRFNKNRSHGGHTFSFNQEHAQTIIGQLNYRAAFGCPACLDKAFALEVVRHYQSDASRAHEDLAGALAHWKAGSALAERQHLLGQDMKSAKRGVAVAAESVAQRTYVKSVVGETRRLSKLVHTDVLNKFDMTMSQFGQLSRSFRLDGARTSRTAASADRPVSVATRETVSRQAAQKMKGCDAFRVFRSEKLLVRARIGTPAFLAEERRVAALWANVPDEEKAIYAGRGAAKAGVAEQLSAGSITRTAIQQASGSLGPSRTQQLSKQMFVSAYDAIQTHSAWSNGLGLWGAATALTADRVITDVTDKQLRDELQVFAYDAAVVPNPAGTSKPHRSCHNMHFGICPRDALFTLADSGTYNVYAMLFRWGLKRPQLPVLARLEVAGDPSGQAIHFVVADTIGAGLTLLVVGLEPVADADGLLKLKRVAVGIRRIAHCTTGQRFFRSCLLSWSGLERRALDIASLRFDVLSFEKVLHENSLALKAGDPSHTGAIPLRFKIRVRDGPAKPAAQAEATKLPFGIRAPKRRSIQVDADVGLRPQGSPEATATVSMAYVEPLAPPSVVVVPDDEDADAAEPTAAERELDGNLDHIGGGAVGLCGFEEARTGRSRCFVCAGNGLPTELCRISEGGAKFFFRKTRTQIEKSVHAACVTNGNVRAHMSGPHLAHSSHFLVNQLSLPDLSEANQRLLHDALDELSRAAGATSSGAGGSSSAAAPE